MTTAYRKWFLEKSAAFTSAESTVLTGPFVEQEGHSYNVELPELAEFSDCSEYSARSPLLLFEDGKLLYPPHSSHDYVAQAGKGAYSHWNEQLFFSSSDGTDPNENGRVYSYICSQEAYLAAYSKEIEGVAHYLMAGPFKEGDGHSFSCFIPQPIASSLGLLADTAELLQSTLLVCEDGRALKSPHTNHDYIALHGKGKHSHWQDKIYFSSSDGSSPQENERLYTFTSCRENYLSVFQEKIGEYDHLVMHRPFVHQDGLCFSFQIPKAITEVCGVSFPLVVYEDEKPLIGNHTEHKDIAKFGHGGHSLWQDKVLFSSSDGTDPFHNGRKYTFTFTQKAFKQFYEVENSPYDCPLYRIVGPFQHLEGKCWAKRLPSHLVEELKRLCPCSSQVDVNPLLLFEDNVLLGPCDARETDITSIGQGLYFFDGAAWLLFSTSDGTSPNNNGRQYSFSYSLELFVRQVTKLEKKAVSIGLSGLYPCVEETCEEGSAERTCALFKELVYTLETKDFAGKTVLEIGPGPTLGLAAMFLAMKANVAVAELYPAPWSDDFHLPFFNELRQQMAKLDYDFHLPKIDQIINEKSFPKELQLIDEAIENCNLKAQSFDLSFSVAVFEHVYDVKKAARKLYEATKPGGLSVHWIDCGDHRDSAQPLEYLLMKDADFKLTFAHRHGTCGNRLRVKDMEHIFTEAGFEVLSTQITARTDTEYLKSIIARLEAQGKVVDKEELERLSCILLLKRPQ